MTRRDDGFAEWVAREEEASRQRDRLLFDAFVAGFRSSFEGRNGENPYALAADAVVREALTEDFNEWLAGRARSALKGVS